jgi:hypothetical protein
MLAMKNPQRYLVKELLPAKQLRWPVKGKHRVLPMVADWQRPLPSKDLAWAIRNYRPPAVLNCLPVKDYELRTASHCDLSAGRSVRTPLSQGLAQLRQLVFWA